MRKALGFGVAAAALVAATAVVTVVVVSPRTAAGVETWVARQLTAILGQYIVPTLSFDSLEYAPPLMVRVRGAALTAPDGTRVVEAKSLVIKLAEVPQAGKPIVIQSVEVEHGALRLVETRTDGRLGFKGLAPFMKRENIRDQEHAPEGTRLSEVLQIRTVRLRDVAIVYNTGADRPEMRIAGMSFDLDIAPQTGGAEPGWYAASIAARRPPILDLSLDGRLNVDSFVADIRSLRLETRLGEDSYSTLPTELQTILREHEVRGDIRLTASGLLPLADWRGGKLSAKLALDKLAFAAGDGRLPIESGTVQMDLARGVVSVEPVDLAMLSGRVRMEAHAQVAQPGAPTTLEWRVEDVSLEAALRTQQADAGAPPELAGLVKSSGNVGLDLERIPGSIKGEADIGITHGRLVNLPTVHALAQAMGALSELMGSDSHSDSLDATLKLTGDGVVVNSVALDSPAIAVRGYGRIGYDGAMELNLNGGPLEKVQGMLGAVGDVLGAVTDTLVTYRVTGKVGNPSVSVAPLGIGASTRKEMDSASAPEPPAPGQ